jgi:hypothetical protein
MSRDIFDRTHSLARLVEQIEESVSETGEIEAWQKEIIDRLSVVLEEDIESAGLSIHSMDARVDAIDAEVRRLKVVRDRISANREWLERAVVMAIKQNGDAGREYGTLVRVKVVKNPPTVDADAILGDGRVMPWCKSEIRVSGLGPEVAEVLNRLSQQLEKKKKKLSLEVARSESVSKTEVKKCLENESVPKGACVSVHQSERIRVR